jgi:ABC-type transport system involved in multi-copper enzyme maturation permease subunit
MSPVTEASVTTNHRDDLGSAGSFRGLLWLTWRQHRWTLVGTLVLAAVLMGWMTYLSTELTDLYHQCHNMVCPEHSLQGARLDGTSSLVLTVAALLLLVQYMPMLIGVFVGVPLLSREHEQRTLLLAWSQDVSPARWLWAKLSLLGLFVAAVTAAVAGVSDHLEHALANVSKASSMFEYKTFLNTGMLPLAISLCWFALGVALGAAIKRTLPAVFGVVAGFIGLTLLVQHRYLTLMKPLSAYQQLGGPDDGLLRDNALVVKGVIINYGDGPSGVFDAAGRQLTGAELERLCPAANGGSGTEFSCYLNHHLQLHLEYQPGSRIPDLHLIVATGYLGLTAVALAAVWLIVRRTNLSAG